MLRNLLPAIFLFLTPALAAQQYKVFGKITNNKMEPLAFASIQLKNTTYGAVSKADGTYELLLDAGKYELVFTMVGYIPYVIELTVKHDVQQNIILQEKDANSLEAVVVRGKAKDRAEEIIRQVIRNKEAILSAPGPYSCKLYIKAVQQDSTPAGKQHKRKATDTLPTAPEKALLNKMAMAEVLLQLDVENEQRQKEERLAVKTWGDPAGLFYLSATEGNFNFYNNLVKVPALSATPFLSPVSYSGLLAYRFKTTRIQQQGKHKIYTIAVKPIRLSNATVEGELTVSDSAWVVLHTRFRLPVYHLPEYDFFEVEQDYSLVSNTAWMLSRQRFTYYARAGKAKRSGQTVVHYTAYNFHKQFGRKHFGTEISATAAEAFEKDSTFWNSVRTEPLKETEIRFIRYRDSIYRATHTRQYLDSIDREINRVTWKKVAFMGQTVYNRERGRTWNLPPAVSLIQLFSFGGPRISPTIYYERTFPSKKNLSVFANLSYGLNNRDINGNIRLTSMYNPFNRGFYRFAAGRDFQFIFAGDAWINMVKRSNLFLNNFISAGHGLELRNGLFLYADAEIALRRSVSGYKTNAIMDSTFGEYLGPNQAVHFRPYNALYGKLRLQYTPWQRYIREPKEKVILGSAWPTFYASWRKGIRGPFGSVVNFDYLELGMEQEIKLGLTGISRYNIKTGSFPNQKDLRMVDYQFQRRGDPFFFLNPDEAFQALDSSFPVFKRFYQGHYVHEFNGFLLNKIPLFKKLRLREVAGAGFLIAPERNLRYGEAFAGLERVIKWPFNPLNKIKLGIYVVGSAANRFSNPVQIKVGFTTWDKARNKWY